MYITGDEPDSDVESKYLPGDLSHHYRDPLPRGIVIAGSNKETCILQEMSLTLM